MKSTKLLIFTIVMSGSLLFTTTGCKTSNTVKGAAIGGTAGSILGVLLADKGKKARGVLIGGAIWRHRWCCSRKVHG